MGGCGSKGHYHGTYEAGRIIAIIAKPCARLVAMKSEEKYLYIIYLSIYIYIIVIITSF